MPEGPQVKRIGKLIESFKGQQITCIHHPPGSKKQLGISLPNKITGVQVKGKNIFVVLASGEILYNHMLMWGKWCEGCDGLCGKKRLSACIETEVGTLGYYGGGILKLITRQEAASIQNRLGPDIITTTTQKKAFERLASAKGNIGEALLNQELISGVGNIYKSEALFVCRIFPLREVTDLTKKELKKLFRFLHDQMLGDVTNPGIITTTPQLLAKGYRRYVYKRYHQPCLICGTKIERMYQGRTFSRSTYYCPFCQAPKPT